MNFMQWLNSLDELLFEVISWIVFFPVTLWKALRHPLAIMEATEAELQKPDDEQFTRVLSPPLFLVIALLISHALELAVVGDNPIVGDHHGLAGLVNDNGSLLLLRLIVFSVFPIIFATRLVRARHDPLDRATLKAPFYAQCFLVAPFSLALSIGSVFMRDYGVPLAPLVGLALILGALISYGLVQSLWFARKLDRRLFVGFGQASIAMVESLAVHIPLLYLFAL
ncbi:hypothetical protein [Sphingobium aromaticiconvertens]|uniref:hypothetical protein n=1 Tax=Sphingobium aromaticiconvertens TaxID=365341 RepID=UPI00301A3CFC